MFRTLAIAATASTMFALPAFAQEDGIAPTGDAAAGERAFRQCIACHVVQDPEGEILAGRRAQTGPNLYAIAGRAAGSVEGFRGYSDIIVAAGESGIIWNEENFVGYVQDPTAWLQEATGDGGRGKMQFKVRQEDDALNLYAYLASLAPLPEGEGS